jgi:hypothetical protein
MYVGAMRNKMVQCLETIQTANPLAVMDETVPAEQTLPLGNLPNENLEWPNDPYLVGSLPHTWAPFGKMVQCLNGSDLKPSGSDGRDCLC